MDFSEVNEHEEFTSQNLTRKMSLIFLSEKKTNENKNDRLAGGHSNHLPSTR